MAAVSSPPRQAWRENAFRGYWIGLAILAATVTLAIRQPSPGGLFGGLLVIAAALLPAYVWVRRRNDTIPIFPLFTSVIAVTHGFPLVIAPDIVMDYSSGEQFRAAYTVALPLLVATAVWSVVRRLKREPLAGYREIPEKWGDRFFLATLAVGAVTMTAGTAGLIERYQESGAYTAFRAAILACSALSCFSLGFRHGQGRLTRRVVSGYCILLAANVVASSATLLLNTSIAYLVLAFAGFSLGRRRIPWLAIIPIAVLFSVLHAGKEDMRTYYWYGSQSPYFSPVEYPSVYGEWLGKGVANFSKLDQRSDTESILNRAGLVYLLLHVQSLSPDRVPFVEGASYSHIPLLLVPRLLYPEKPGAHDGTVLLNIHYGLQTMESSATTTIGWGLFNEAYANFGFLGGVALMVFVAVVLALVERWSAGMPMLSFRRLAAVLLLSTLIGADATLAVFIASFAQGFVVLATVAAFLMRRRRLPPGR